LTLIRFSVGEIAESVGLCGGLDGTDNIVRAELKS